MTPEILEILTNPLGRSWTVQGLGMMRTYLSETQRLHIWHSALQIPNATRIHDHPWNFTSEILFGEIHQFRATYNLFGSVILGEDWLKQEIVCGEHGGIDSEPEPVKLQIGEIEIYREGDTYRQEAHELHDSFPIDNTVTIITREYLEDLEHARVFFPKGEHLSARSLGLLLRLRFCLSPEKFYGPTKNEGNSGRFGPAFV
jgi:hypothetical protein